MNPTRWILVALPMLALVGILAGGETAPRCVPVEPGPAVCAAAADCEGLPASDPCAGVWVCLQGECVWDCRACSAELCGDGEDNDCDGRVDEGCAGDTCYGQADCSTGLFCRIEDDCCPPSWCEPGMDCPAVCEPCGTCHEGAAACTADCDCYEAGIAFEEGCYMACAMCDSYWLCLNGTCAEHCGPVPQHLWECRQP